MSEARMVPRKITGRSQEDHTGKLFLLPPIDDDFGADVRSARMFFLPDEMPEWPD
jgi:hypothetical protein